MLMNISAFSQGNPELVKHIESNYKTVIPDKMLMSSCECSNLEYGYYLNSLSPEIRFMATPDSTGWRFEKLTTTSSQFYNEPMVNVYNWHPAYKEYPVVNINQAAAKAYCAWLTSVYNATPGRKYSEVEFRLPTLKEWQLASTGISKNKNQKRIYPWDGLKTVDSKGKYKANYGVFDESRIQRDKNGNLVTDSATTVGGFLAVDGFMYTAPCKAFSPNEYGLYHMVGNVSEFLDEYGHTAGGGFISPPYYLQIQNTKEEFEHQEMGAAWIGFRPVMIVKKK